MKAQATSREIGLASAVIIVLMLYLYLSTPRVSIVDLGPTFNERCELQGNFSCYSVFLKKGGQLEISIAQNTGKLINITSFICTNNSTVPAMPLLNNTVLIPSGKGNNVSGGNSGNTVICTGADGRSIPNASVGDRYYGIIYFTYTEVKTQEVGFVNGTLLTKYS